MKHQRAFYLILFFASTITMNIYASTNPSLAPLARGNKELQKEVKVEIQRLRAGFKKENRYLSNGQFFGGESDIKRSLISLKKVTAQKAVRQNSASPPQQPVERILFEFGDEKGLSTQKVSSFLVHLRPEQKRIDIELNKMSGASFRRADIEKLSQNSQTIRSVKMLYDPEAQSIIIQLHLKADVQIEVMEFLGQKKSGRLALDILKI